MKVIPIGPLGQYDNYVYAIYSAGGQTMALVDPADWPSVKQFIRGHPVLSGLTLSHVLTTHKHHDHAEDNRRIAQEVPGVKIVGGRPDNVLACNMPVDDGNQFQLPGGLLVTCLQKPCHTRGSVIFCITDANCAGTPDDFPRGTFTGDMIFVGGVGYFFEGTGADMMRAFEAWAQLCPDDTIVFPGHEYAVANYEWSHRVEKTNPKLVQRLNWAQAERAAGRPCMSTVGEEKETNVFMRAPLLMSVTKTSNPDECLGRLRQWKNEKRSS